jgi:hypothetical protein
MPKSQIKSNKTTRQPRKNGGSNGNVVRIASAAVTGARKKVASKGSGRRGRSYDDWSKSALLERAKEVGIKGRSAMNKSELVKALRSR